jgi:hypothetical protein
MTSQTASQRWGQRQPWPQNLRRYTSDHAGVSPGLLFAGLAVLGLGALAAYHYGPDLIRYIKIERM